MQRICLSLVIIIIMYLTSTANVARAQQETPTPSPSDVPTGTPISPRPLGTPELSIRSPLPGQAVQGSVPIAGSSAVTGFVSAEVSFTYASDQTGTWFFIGDTNDAVVDGTLAQWDTSSITDGDYDLRLRVLREDGSYLDAVILGLRVRNYTPIETATPTPVTPTATQMPGELTATSTAIPMSLPSVTPLPTNPAEITGQDIAWGLGKGALAVIGLFALMGVYKLVNEIGNKEQ